MNKPGIKPNRRKTGFWKKCT